MAKSPYVSKYQPETYTSFSGCDIIASITPPGCKPIVIGSIQTISYSIHRDKTPVRPVGHINPIAYCYGGRTISGTMIFTVFDRHVIKHIIEEMFEKELKEGETEYNQYFGENPTKAQITWIKQMHQRILTDELPPFDVHIIMRNEYGSGSSMILMGVTLVDEGQVMSIEDMLIENTVSFMALDIQLMENEKYLDITIKDE